MPILLYLLIPVVALFVGAFAYDLNRRRRRSSGHDIDSGARDRPGGRRGPSHTWRSLASRYSSPGEPCVTCETVEVRSSLLFIFLLGANPCE